MQAQEDCIVIVARSIIVNGNLAIPFRIIIQFIPGEFTIQLFCLHKFKYKVIQDTPEFVFKFMRVAPGDHLAGQSVDK